MNQKSKREILLHVLNQMFQDQIFVQKLVRPRVLITGSHDNRNGTLFPPQFLN
jgi:hypothetical protein